MAILAFGISHRTAPIDLREQLAFTEPSLAEALNDALASIPGLREIAILSTCNRAELYCIIDGEDADPVTTWLAGFHDLDLNQVAAASYAHWNDEAATHLMRVASGLDSMVVGEPQILGQVKDAMETARRAGSLGPELDRLVRHTLNNAKQVRTDTEVGSHPISVAYASVSLAQRIFGPLENSQALLIGAGDTIELVARHLRDSGIGRIVIANRTIGNAQSLAAECQGEAITLDGIAKCLPQVDLVISSTGAAVPVLGKGAVEAALKLRRRRPFFMVDIAVPRDIEPQVGELGDVYLYTIDDISAIIDENLRMREQAARAAEKIVEEGSARFMNERREHDIRHTLTRFRQRAEDVQKDAVERALKALHAGRPAEQVIEQLAHELTNKLIHHPTVGLRKASAAGNREIIDAAHDLLDLGEER